MHLEPFRVAIGKDVDADAEDDDEEYAEGEQQ